MENEIQEHHDAGFKGWSWTEVLDCLEREDNVDNMTVNAAALREESQRQFMNQEGMRTLETMNRELIRFCNLNGRVALRPTCFGRGRRVAPCVHGVGSIRTLCKHPLSGLVARGPR